MAPSLWDNVVIVKQEEDEAHVPAGGVVMYAMPPADSACANPPPLRASPSRPTATATPRAPYPPPVLPATQFRVPIPPDTDRGFRQEIYVKGKLGLQLSKCCSLYEDISPGRLFWYIMQNVDGAANSLDHYCYGKYVWIDRAYFPNEAKTGGDLRANPKQNNQPVTVASLLAPMVEKQHKDWRDRWLWEVTGMELLADVDWDSFYIVAIRRRKSKSPDASYCWFPELEIRCSAGGSGP